MEISSEQERYLHAVLDKGLQKLTPTFSESPSVITKASISFADSQPSIQSEVQALSDKVASLQSLFLAHSSSSVPPPRPQSSHPAPPPSTDFKALLAQERRRQQALIKENQQLKKRVRKGTSVVSDVEQLRKDLAALQKSFEQSESIRIKQKHLIERLRKELNWEVQTPYKPILKPVRERY